METQAHETTPTRFAVRPLRINVPEEALVDLRRRVAAHCADRREVGRPAHAVPVLPRPTRHHRCEYDWRDK